MVIGSNILAGSSGQGGGYNLTRSLRFRNSASAYLSRTFGSGNQQKWTWSDWVKRGTLGSEGALFSAYQDDNNRFCVKFRSDNAIEIESVTGGGQSILIRTTQVFRDPSSWYHFVLAFDTTQATDTNRVKLYINGTQVTAFSTATYPSQNSSHTVNGAYAHNIGRQNYSSPFAYFDGYRSEIQFVGGSQLTPSSFGETSTTTGVWQPKKYTGTYGTNGFYLPFSDNTSTTTLGADSSGNGNNWTCNNISLTSGSTYDSMTDVPTLTSATAANFCTWNPLFTLGNQSLTEGNLKCATGTSGGSIGTIQVNTGKIYWEITPTSVPYTDSRVAGISEGLTSQTSLTSKSIYLQPDGKYSINNATAVSYGTSFTNNDVIGVAIDIDAKTIKFYKNGTALGGDIDISSVYSTGNYIVPAIVQSGGASTVLYGNFGQRPFAYTPPTGYVALNTYNLPTPTIGATASSQANKYFDATTYTGNGSSGLAVTNAGGFQPDFVWVKVRNATDYHNLADSVRGVYKRIFSNDTQAENTNTETLQSFNSNGFTVGNNGNWNTNGAPHIAWQWKANGTGVTNTAGSITSTVSANTTSGFSVVTYTSTTGTVGHGLGVAPAMIIMKARNLSDQWTVGHQYLNGGSSPWNYGLPLNTDAGLQTNSGFWNNTAPTSTVFSQGSWDSGYTKVAYCFAEVAGFSKFGTYTGNGSSDGTFIYLGFRPKYVMIRRADATGNWWNIKDTARDPYNTATHALNANLADAEYNPVDAIDFVSNGLKIRATSTINNNNGTQYIYMAFAENPFKYSLAR